MDIATSAQPTATEVAAMITRWYRRPALLRLKPVVRKRMVIWERTFDGVPSVAYARTYQFRGGFRTRFVRELVEPEPVRRASLVGEKRAIASSGLTPDLVDLVELIFRPTYGRRQLPNTAGDNAADYDQVIERSDLVYGVKDSKNNIAFVDAYTGAVLLKGSLNITD